jgi:hypothetical protein
MYKHLDDVRADSLRKFATVVNRLRTGAPLTPGATKPDFALSSEIPGGYVGKLRLERLMAYLRSLEARGVEPYTCTP